MNEKTNKKKTRQHSEIDRKILTNRIRKILDIKWSKIKKSRKMTDSYKDGDYEQETSKKERKLK